MFKLTGNGKWSTESDSCSDISMRTFSLAAYHLHTHESPVSERKVFRQGVEGYVATWALGVMVRTCKAWAGGMEATAGNQGWRGGRSDDGSSKHLVGQPLSRQTCISGTNIEEWSTGVIRVSSQAQCDDADLPYVYITALN